MPFGMTKCSHLLKIYIIHTRSFLQNAISCIIKFFVIMRKVAQQAPSAMIHFEVAADKKHFKFVIVKTENHTIHRNGYSWIRVNQRNYVFDQMTGLIG